MYYRGRLLDKYTEKFGAMSYDTTIAGRACELFKSQNQSFLNLYSKKRITEEFKIAGNELNKVGLDDEADELVNRAKITIDQGIGGFLLIPLSFCDEVIGIFTMSSLKESSEDMFLGIDVEKNFVPVAQMLSLILYMEKISYDKAEEMGRLLISSIDGKDEYQATHSLNVRSMIDIFIDELSRDKELRNRVGYD
jgi:HD-GYP domain-containing protein (c-di-GMP phosphodiesterase class II)